MIGRLLWLWVLTLAMLCAWASSVNAQEPGTLRIYIARHGETRSNAEGRVLGQLDEPLTPRGVAQAEDLRTRLHRVHLDAIYASPLTRSLETAAIVADGRTVRVVGALKERSQGRLQGEIAASVPNFAKRMADPADSLDGGETAYALSTRVKRGLEIVRNLTPSGSVLIVGHFLVNQMLVREILGLSMTDGLRVIQANDELYLFEVRPRRRPLTWKLIPATRLGEL